MGHVGDVNEQARAAPRELLHRDRVVEVLGGLAVDRHRRRIVEQGSSFPFLGADHGRQLPGGLERRLGKGQRQPVLAGDDVRVHARLVEVTEDLQDLTLGGLPLASPAEDLETHDLAVAGPAAKRFANSHRCRHAGLEGLDAASRRLAHEDAERPTAAPLERAHDHSLEPIASTAARHTHGDSIARQTVTEMRRSDEDIRPLLFGDHEAVSVAVTVQDSLHPVRRPHGHAPSGQPCDSPFAQQLAKHATHGPALLRRDVHVMQEFTLRQGSVVACREEVEQGLSMIVVGMHWVIIVAHRTPWRHLDTAPRDC